MIRTKMRWVRADLALFSLLIVLLLALILPGEALAQDDEPGQHPNADGIITDDEVNVIAKQLYCPVCENVPLDVCGTQACADWREEIRMMLSEGRSEQDIKNYFADRYGRRVLATPDASGIDLFLWLLPVLGVIIAAVILVLALRRMAPQALRESIAPEAALRYDGLDPELVARVEAELREFASR